MTGDTRDTGPINTGGGAYVVALLVILVLLLSGLLSAKESTPVLATPLLVMIAGLFAGP